VAFTGQPVYASIPLIKQAPQRGVTYVFGLASDGRVDRDRQIVDEGFIKSAIRAWHGADGGPVRMAHDPRRPVGKSVEIDGLHVKSAIYDRDARRLLKHGVLRAYSVGISGPTIVPDPVAKGGRIVAGELVELSVVDSPANVGCGVTLCKAAPGGRLVWVGEAFVKGSGGYCLAGDCGARLKGKWKHCHGCGRLNPMFNERELPVKKKWKKKALKAGVPALSKSAMLTAASGSRWPVHTTHQAVTVMLMDLANDPDPGTRMAAEAALKARAA
jgi:hypothetical protein